MIGVFNNISIEGIAAAVPSMIEENIAASAFLGERRCKKQIKLTGIKERHVSPQGQKISDLCYVASDNLLDHLRWDVSEIKVLVILTQHPDFVAPSTAFYMQKLLGLPQDSIVFDVNIGCSGFNVGLHIVGSLLQQFPRGTKALCMQGDLAGFSIMEGISADDMSSMMLFGSGASVFAAQKNDSSDNIHYETYSIGNDYDAIMCRQGEYVKMDGTAVFNFSTNYVVERIRDFMRRIKINDTDIDYYVFHQAQKLILDSIQLDLGFRNDKELRSLERYGNTSGASVPISICANQESVKNKETLRLFTCGFGVGLSCSMAHFTIASGNVLPLIFTDYINS